MSSSTPGSGRPGGGGRGRSGGPPRRTGGGGGGSGRGGSGSGSGSRNRRSETSNASERSGYRNNRDRGGGRQLDAGRPAEGSGSALRDEDVLITFMSFLKGDNPEASRIHEDYQTTKDQESFIKAARGLIERQQRPSGAAPFPNAQSQRQQRQPLTQARSLQEPPTPSGTRQPHSLTSTQRPPSSPSQQPTLASHLPLNPDFSSHASGPMHQLDTASLFERPVPSSQFAATDSGLCDGSAPVTGITVNTHPQRLNADMTALTLNSEPMAVMQSIWAASPLTPPRADASPAGPATTSSPWAATTPASTNNYLAPAFLTPPRDLEVEFPGTSRSDSAGTSKLLPSFTLPPRRTDATLPSDLLNAEERLDSSLQAVPLSSGGDAATPATRSISPPAPDSQRRGARAPPVTRRWTHFAEQPGRLAVNGRDGRDPSLVLPLPPRQELYAHWSLPLKYLEQARRVGSLGDALKNLAVGLFRRGCAENASQASIISKFVTERNDYAVDAATQTVRGRVPFFSPRTPGHVVLRLYWHDDPAYTLATGPTLLVHVAEPDFDASVRFILSNFKGKKTNPASLSSLLSLAQILETPLTVQNESAARAIWGCIQEARKVVEVCYAEYIKTCNKLEVLELEVEELKKQVEDEEAKSHTSASMGVSQDGTEDEVQSSLREKTRLLMSGRASNLRKWRDSQLAFAAILRAAVTNPSISMLLRRDMIAKMRVELQLWCPLAEEFAIPDETSKLWFESLKNLSGHVIADDFRAFTQHRTKMQLKTLGFEPNNLSLEDILFPRNPSSPNHRNMDSGAVVVFNNMSAAMGKYFHSLYHDEDRVVRLREMIREKVENIVTKTGAFPQGTRVVIFGSSANGFGSLKSDIDMCLLLPPGSELLKEDSAGSSAMEKLADSLSQSGMEDVDSSRLTARIPIIRFFCPNFLPGDEDDEDKLIECDLSMHNPLAVLNTSLLRTYAEITPITRVLAAVIKRWAKERDINNPSRHTLSSYGYVLMLLHFLTYHKRNDNCLLVPIAPSEGNLSYRMNPNQQGTPLLPNLQWVDPRWPGLPKGSPYRELPTTPEDTVSHPFEEGKKINRYFYRPSTPEEKANLQNLFSGQDLSLAILLASFFRYYAYEFDYRKCVVSLHSTAARGLVQREVKTELDGWRNYSAVLTIEDPFETFYDVAHVLRGGEYHRIRREFAVAYSKIADAASGRQGSWKRSDLQSLTGEQLIDWICEPIAIEKELGEQDTHDQQ